ncbi:MAG: alcohol dehydrogenase catalytic domain-containing protein [Anaerolineae bacterium]
MAKLAAYRRAESAPPARHWLWPLYGQGLENLGQDDQPIEVDLPVCGPDELLVRHDAVGLCFSDTKVIAAGEHHPRLAGRDMKANPVVLGHEVALTVMQVGANRRDRFQPGDRFIMQADIYYHGVGLAYGYALQGGLSQYNVVGQEILDGDEGCYLLPVAEGLGYAQSALTEPWACVTRSYDVVYRASWQPRGDVLIVAGPAVTGQERLGAPYADGHAPARAVTVGVDGALAADLQAAAVRDGVALEKAPSLDGLAGRTFADVVILGGDVALYEALEPLAGKDALICLVGGQGYRGAARVDVGRLHYDNLALVSTAGGEIGAAYRPIRTQLKPGGAVAMLGVAGPMGQMHFQRALQLTGGPRLLVGTDLLAERLQALYDKYQAVIESDEQDTHVILKAPPDRDAKAFNDGLLAETGGAGFDDIIVLAPSTGVVAGAVPMMAPGATMNVFAGLPMGSLAAIDLGLVVSRDLRFTGTSGSGIGDLRSMLNEAESGRLDPNLSVVAISGLRDTKQGLDGVIHQRYPGKVVIYPQVLDFPLTLLSDLREALPNVYARLGPNESWTVAAEEAFLEEMLP